MRAHTVAAGVAVDARIRQLAMTWLRPCTAPDRLAATQVNVHERIVVIDISETHDELRVSSTPRSSPSPREESEEGCPSVLVSSTR
jgi:peptide deformylase